MRSASVSGAPARANGVNQSTRQANRANRIVAATSASGRAALQPIREHHNSGPPRETGIARHVEISGQRVADPRAPVDIGN